MTRKKAPIANPPAKHYTPVESDEKVILYLKRSNVVNSDSLHPKPVGLPRPKRDPLSLAKAIAGGHSKSGKPNAPIRIGTKWPKAA